MTGDEERKDWKSNPLHGLEKTYTGPFGQKILEHFDPQLTRSVTRREEDFQDERGVEKARRVLHIPSGIAPKVFDYVKYSSVDSNSSIRIGNTSSDIKLELTKEVEDEFKELELTYRNGKLARGTINVESSSPHDLNFGAIDYSDAYKFLEDNPAILNKMEEEAQYPNIGYEEALAYFGEDHPIVKKSDYVVEDIYEEALKQVPFELKAGFTDIFQKINFKKDIAGEFLLRMLHDEYEREIVLTKDFGKYEDKTLISDDPYQDYILELAWDALDSFVADISDAYYISGNVLAKRLQMNFSSDHVDIIEVDVEESTVKSTPDISQRIKETKLEYGQELNVIGQGFKISKNGNEIHIVSTQAGKTKWEAFFPLDAPVEDIIKVFNDPDDDFRKIKELLPVKFIHHSQ